MVGRQLLQFQENDLVPNVVDRRERRPVRGGTEHLQHTLRLPSRRCHVSQTLHGRADGGEDASADPGPGVTLRLPGHANHALSLWPVVDLQQGIDVLADRDRAARAVQRLAVDPDQIDEPFALELVDLLAGRGGEGEYGEPCAGREPEPRGVLLGRGPPLEHGQEHLAADAAFDVARRARLDHMWCRNPRRLRQGMQGFFGERCDRVIDPDGPDHPAAGADRHRRPGVEVLDLLQPALENLTQRVLVGGHHTVRLEHASVHSFRMPSESGTWRPRIDRRRAGIDRLVAERREGEHAPRRVFDRDGSADHSRDRIRQCEQVPDGHPSDPSALVGLGRETARVEEEAVELCPGHLLGHRKNRHPRGRRRPAQTSTVPRSLEHDGARLGLLGVQQQLLCLRRARSNRDGEHDDARRDRRALTLVVDDGFSHGHREAARSRDQLDDVAAETLEERLEDPPHRLPAPPVSFCASSVRS